ncbi:hypothetical protein JD969_09030 [Planctomycetota bacterium]|nr:hypothetical protein JD969_09030 [Planctomycetota bacterium]
MRILIVSLLLFTSGCVSESNIIPVLQHTNTVLNDQINFIDQVIQKDFVNYENTRKNLDEVFFRDVMLHDTQIDKDWICEANQVYGIALQNLVTNYFSEKQKLINKQDQLRKASLLNDKAVSLLIYQQDMVTQITDGFLPFKTQKEEKYER